MSVEQIKTKCRAAMDVYDNSLNLDSRAKTAIAELAAFAKKDPKDKIIRAAIAQMESSRSWRAITRSSAAS